MRLKMLDIFSLKVFGPDAVDRSRNCVLSHCEWVLTRSVLSLSLSLALSPSVLLVLLSTLSVYLSLLRDSLLAYAVVAPLTSTNGSAAAGSAHFPNYYRDTTRRHAIALSVLRRRIICSHIALDAWKLQQRTMHICIHTQHPCTTICIYYDPHLDW